MFILLNKYILSWRSLYILFSRKFSAFFMFIFCIGFIVYIQLLLLYDSNTIDFQFLVSTSLSIGLYKTILFWGIDGFNCWFVLLTFVITILSYIWIYNDTYSTRDTFGVMLLFIIGVTTILTFLTLDFFVFFCLFEVLLLPMFFLFTYYTSRNRSKKAVVYFYIYTVVGSLLLFLGIIIIISTTGTTNYIYLKEYWFNLPKQVILVIFLLPGFATKIPVYPFHLWLPEAHVEAPTIGSVLLAALLLKLGCYGILRFMLGFTAFGIIYFGPLILVLSLISSFLSSLSALRQIDFKKLIAYSSINHMGLVLAGICSYNIYALEGSVHLMLSHGLVSAGLFFCIGSLYERFHTKLILYYTGMSKVIPLNMFFLFFFIQGNISFPGTWAFVSELLIFTGMAHSSILITIGFKIPVFINTLYSILAFSKVAFGQYTNLELSYTKDLSYREIVVLYYLLFWTLIFGLMPEIISNNIYFYLKSLLIY